MNWKDIPAIDQEKAVIVIDGLPDYTPRGQRIYITETFNNWKTDDPEYIISRDLKGQYYISIPKRSDEMNTNLPSEARARKSWITGKIPSPTATTNLALPIRFLLR